MDRQRGDRYGPDQPYPPHSRFSDSPLNFPSAPRPFHSPPPPPSSFPPSGFPPIPPSNYHPPPLTGHKRAFPFSTHGGASPDRSDATGFAKLFVGSVPRTATEEDIRPLFEQHGNVIEVALIKDKRTGQQQGCCFVKYTTSEEADRAIRTLHNQHTLPGGVGPVQVRYADGERERLGAVEYKLFVGSLNKQATEKEVKEIFSPYGLVEDVYLMRDEMKQSRGCGFVKYSHRDMALAAINALNGIYTMRGCDQPLSVRFADPKKPRSGDSRGTPAFGGPGFGPRFQSPGPRPMPSFGEFMGDQMPFVPSADAGIHPFGSQLPPRSSEMGMPWNLGGPAGGFRGPNPGLVNSISPVSQQNFNQSAMPHPPLGQQASPVPKSVQSPKQLPPSSQVPPHPSASYSQTHISTALVHQLGQPHSLNSSGQIPLSQAVPSQQSPGLGAQLPVSQPMVQQGASSAAAIQPPQSINLQPNAMSAANQQQLPTPVHQRQQSPSQLAQMLSQQTQTLQASFQSSQQAFSQLQQQLQLIQPANQSLTLQQNSQTIKQQWVGVVPHTVANTTAPAPSDTPSTIPPPVPVNPQVSAPVKSNWTEHTSPDGYKYYYNSVTGESKWERPEELMLIEQQQKPSVLQPQNQLHPQLLSAQQLPQTQQTQLQAQFQTQTRNHQPSQQPSLPLLEGSYTQVQTGRNSFNDPARFHQGLQVTQEWAWKNK